MEAFLDASGDAVEFVGGFEGVREGAEFGEHAGDFHVV